MSKKKKQSYWKVVLFETDVKHSLSYDPGTIEFTNELFPSKITKQISWLKGEGAYGRSDHTIPTLSDIWNMLKLRVSSCDDFIFGKWIIRREYECFRYHLMESVGDEIKTVYTNIIGDDLACRTHFIEFLYMLREIKKEIDQKRDGKLIGYDQFNDKRIEAMCSKLDSAIGES